MRDVPCFFSPPATTKAMSSPEAIELTDADEQAKTLVERCLDDMTGRVRRLLAEIKRPLACFAPELERMPVPSIAQRRQRIGLEAFLEPINGGLMPGDERPGVSLLHGIPLLEISQELVFGSTALGRGQDRQHGEVLQKRVRGR